MLSRPSLFKLPWDVDVSEGGKCQTVEFEKVKEPVERSPHPWSDAKTLRQKVYWNYSATKQSDPAAQVSTNSLSFTGVGADSW